METRLRTEYDADISRVVIAHRCSIGSADDMDAYVHGRNVHGLVCVISGQAEYCFADGKNALLRVGDIAFVPSSAAYTMHRQGTEPFVHYTVNFMGNAESFPHWMLQNNIHILHSRDIVRYQARFEEMAELWRHMRTGYRMQTKAKLLMLMADYIAECTAQNVDPASYNRTLPAKRMMEERYAESLTLAEMAEQCGMCVGSFRRAFAAVYHQSPIAYLLNLRIEKAKDFLLVGFTLEETAQQTGFNDVNYFIRFFRKSTGMTPGQFRQHM